MRKRCSLPPGPRRCEGGGRGGVTREEGKDLCVPRLVEFLDFGFHFRHERAECALASYRGERSITVSDASSLEGGSETYFPRVY
jgi:hypothetical protein